ncbi:hypothetical protein BDV23DRAFT_147179 [Aspergillus alliaceus]|uniref:Uncharacterized protein n=1 Tax=Petromyces alliaceus TaxID=209559 RepID=A0A5N7CKP6_PETAA|nr:uncharacterized protein BDW43DRAFT_274551 [Aspergillus alliaceus]KAB8234207.1 hypothetical protein BDW43DRAFT_274551 [Aspergillus alliaceus]KAE8394439.1 hypothetical protein BDV23DRAFT_147179 [Aspergillus alliaceus]
MHLSLSLLAHSVHAPFSSWTSVDDIWRFLISMRWSSLIEGREGDRSKPVCACGVTSGGTSLMSTRGAGAARAVATAAVASTGRHLG